MELKLDPIVQAFVDQIAKMVLEKVKVETQSVEGLSEQITEALNNYDFSSAIESCLDNNNLVEDAVSDAVDNMDLEDKVTDCIKNLTFDVSVS